MTCPFAWSDYGHVFEERHPVDDKFAGAVTVEEVEQIFRGLAKAAHPDTGGTNQDMYELNEAKARALLRVRRTLALARTMGATI